MYLNFKWYVLPLSVLEYHPKFCCFANNDAYFHNNTVTTGRVVETTTVNLELATYVYISNILKQVGWCFATRCHCQYTLQVQA